MTEGSGNGMNLANMICQSMASLEGISTNIARNTNVRDVICFNVTHDIEHLPFLATLFAYSCSSKFFTDDIFTESHHGLDLLIKLFKIK